MNSKKLVRIFLMLVFFVMIHMVSSNASVEQFTYNSGFYTYAYGDLNAAFGDNDAALRNHFVNYGIGEGRQGSIYFDVKYYLESNPDLIAAFGGKNYAAAYNHFIHYGYKEGRVGAPIFDVKFYLENNPDLVAAFGADNYDAAYNHFVYYGMEEGRASSRVFDVNHYLANNGDVAAAFGAKNYGAAYNHYATHGMKEGRKATITDHVYGPETVKEATCTENGSIAKACKVCGHVEVTETEKAGHKIKEGEEPVVIQEGSCEQEKIVEYECAVCGEKVRDITPALDHDWVYEAQKTAPTCDKEGEELYACSRCDKTKVETIEKLGHNYVKDTSAGAINQEATCSTEGYTTTRCTRCGDIQTEKIPATGKHEFDDTKPVVVSKVPTCTENGTVTYTCKTCGKEQKDEVIPAAHVWDEANPTVITTVTCLEDGKSKVACKRCGETKEVTVKAEGHKFTETTTPATCQAEGEVTKTCSVCNKVEKTTLPKTAHDWEIANPATDIPAGTKCGEKADVKFTCKTPGCGETKTENITVTHDMWGNGTTIATGTYADGDTYTITGCANPKCDARTETRTCTDTEEIAVVSHDNSNAIVNKMCKNCGKIERNVKRAVKAEDHKNVEGKVTTEATCNAEGVISYSCKDCGASVAAPEGAPVSTPKDYTKHILLKDDSATNTEATCNAEGENHYKCTVCNTTAVEKTPINKAVDTTKPHGDVANSNHKNWTKTASEDATCAVDGYEEYTCDDCGAVIRETTAAKDLSAGHKWNVGAYEIKDGADKGKYRITIYCPVCDRTHETDTVSADVLTTEDAVKEFVANFDLDAYMTTSDYTNYVATLK